MPLVLSEEKSTLTPRELEILTLLAQEGRTNKEMAHQVGIHELTVRAHLNHCCKKVGVRNRVQLVLWALRNDIVPLFPPPPQQQSAGDQSLIVMQQ